MSTDPNAPGSRPSRAASAQYDWTCFTCGAGPLKPCRSASGRVTDTHHSRLTPASTQSSSSLSENQTAVLAGVKAAETPHTVTELAAELGLAPTSARSAIMGLQMRGLVTVVGSASSGGTTYGLTEAGRAW